MPAPPLASILGARLGSVDPDILESVAIKDILYGASTRGRATRSRLEASWLLDNDLQPGWVYVRTLDAIYRTSYRSVEKILERLPGNFARAHRGLFINLEQRPVYQFGRAPLHFAVFEFPEGREIVSLSRNESRRIRSRYRAGHISESDEGSG